MSQYEPLSNFFKGRCIAVTGAAGTVGSELVRQLMSMPIKELRALDNNESELFYLGELYREDERLHALLCDIRHEPTLTRFFEGVDYVFHAAANKHVPMCERSPFDAVQTNILGVQNLISASQYNSVKKIIFTSTDKAVNPTNVMGTTKLMGERLITAAHAIPGNQSSPIFASTRFGNVAGSRGSVIPLFCRQIAQGGPITITDEEMTRFVMTLQHAVHLVMFSMQCSNGGEVFVTKMPVLRIIDLAQVMVDKIAPLYGHEPTQVEIRTVGARPGEKMYEELMNDEEARRSLDSDSELLVILPALKNIYNTLNLEYRFQTFPVSNTYHSANEPFMSKEEISTFLLEDGVLPDDVRTLMQNTL